MAVSKREFNALASMVSEIKHTSRSIDYEALAERLANICQASNPHFDRKRFMFACGAGEPHLPGPPTCGDMIDGVEGCPRVRVFPSIAARTGRREGERSQPRKR